MEADSAELISTLLQELPRAFGNGRQAAEVPVSAVVAPQLPASPARTKPARREVSAKSAKQDDAPGPSSTGVGATITAALVSGPKTVTGVTEYVKKHGFPGYGQKQASASLTYLKTRGRAHYDPDTGCWSAAFGAKSPENAKGTSHA